MKRFTSIFDVWLDNGVEFDFEANVHVAGLQSRDPRWKMRVGKYYGLPFIELKRGVWNVQLKYHDAARWVIQRRNENPKLPPYSEAEIEDIRFKNETPHWKWLVTPVGGDGKPEEALGRVPELTVDSDPLIISQVVRFIADDPCLVPNGKATTGFVCPECKGDWKVAQSYPWGKWREENNQEEMTMSLEEMFMLSEAEYWPLEPNPAKVGNLPLVADLFVSRND